MNSRTNLCLAAAVLLLLIPIWGYAGEIDETDGDSSRFRFRDLSDSAAVELLNFSSSLPAQFSFQGALDTWKMKMNQGSSVSRLEFSHNPGNVRVLTIGVDGTGSSGVLGVNTAIPTRALDVNDGDARLLFGLESSDPSLRLVNGTQQWALRISGTTNDFELAKGSTVALTTNASGDVTVADMMSAAVVEIRGEGNDLAEGFVINGDKEVIRPGMVVSIDASSPGQMSLCTIAYDRKVAGIISGAGDKHMGIQLGDITDGELPVALTGQVWCYVDATVAPVVPGDTLTTSATPGHAMKVEDFGRAQGAIIGKAMTALPEGRGLVLVLVNLH